MLRTQEDSKRIFEYTVERFGIKRGEEHGMYAPLARRFPLYIDDAIPPLAKMCMVKNNTCACINSDVVYVDTQRAMDFFVTAREATKEKRGGSTDITDYSARNNYTTILAHEYTHILMQHVEKGIKFCNTNGDENYPIFAYACDIEANRGYLVDDCCDVYQIAVTDDAFPKCKGVVGLMNIYRTLKKYYGDEILRNYNEAKNEQSAENEENKEQGKSEDGSTEGKGKGKGKGKPAGKEESKTSESSSSTPTDSPEHRKEVIQQNAHSVEELRSEMEKLKAILPPDQLNKNVECYDEESGSAVGVDGDEEGIYDVSPRQVLGKYYKQANKAQFDKALSRLKGIVKGETARSRVKTYSRQSRKSSDDGLIRKGTKQGKNNSPRVLVAMDSSGSMSATTVTPIAEAIGTLAKMLGKTKGSWICEHDASVKNVKPLSQWEDVVRGYYPRGDNDFNEVMKKALELDVDAVLNIGDGYAHITDLDTSAQAAKRGLKWYDVQVCGSVRDLKDIYKTEENWFSRHNADYVKREIIPCVI